jgi:hypothetical protein
VLKTGGHRRAVGERDARSEDAGGEGLPALIGTAAVQRRYGLRDPRAARKVMIEAGGFVVAGRMVVRVDDLDRLERDRSSRRNQAEPPRGAGHHRRSAPKRRAPLEPGWWRSDEAA